MSKNVEFLKARVVEFSSISVRQILTFILFVGAFGLIAKNLHPDEYVSLMLIYNKSILLSGILLFGHPTMLQYRFATKEMSFNENRKAFITILIVSGLIAAIGTLFLSLVSAYAQWLAIWLFLFFYTVFGQIISVAYGLGSIKSINTAEVAGSLIFFSLTFFFVGSSIQTILLLLAFSYALRSIVLALCLKYTSESLDVLSLSRGKKKNLVVPSFWGAGFSSASNIFLFRSIFPLAEGHAVTGQQAHSLALIWPMVERIFSVSSNANAILFKYIASGSVRMDIIRLIGWFIALSIPIVFAALWYAFSIIYNVPEPFGLIFYITLPFLFFWAFKSFQANIFMGNATFSTLIQMAVIQILCFMILFGYSIKGVQLGVNLTFIIINIVLCVICVWGSWAISSRWGNQFIQRNSSA